MPSRLPLDLENYPSSFSLEPMPFITVEDTFNLRRGFVRGYPLRGYGHFSVSPLVPTLIQLNGWRVGLQTWQTSREREFPCPSSIKVTAYILKTTWT